MHQPKVSTPPPPPIPPKKSIGARPYGFKNLYPSKKPATVTQQLQKSVDFRRIELYDFHLRSGLKMVCILSIVYGNLNSKNSQDYAQKPERNCTFMNSASGLQSMSVSKRPNLIMNV